jgi:hypothetical protein
VWVLLDLLLLPNELDEALDWGAEREPLLADHLPSSVLLEDEASETPPAAVRPS